jgi:hypothetical protein
MIQIKHSLLKCPLGDFRKEEVRNEGTYSTYKPIRGTMVRR